MKICIFRGVTLRVHPLFLLIFLVYLLAGQTVMMLAGLLALLLHEAGHFYIARRLSLPISEIELTPFGGAMQIPISDGLTGWPAFRLAFAGIAVNLCCILFCLLSFRLHMTPFTVYFSLANTSMLLINLLPALPLDDGRMLLALLTLRYPRPAVFRALLILGRVLAACLLLRGVWLAIRGTLQPVWCVCGCYMLYAASLEEQHSATRYLSAFFRAGFAWNMGKRCRYRRFALRVICRCMPCCRS